MTTTKYKHRFVARIVLEAATPLALSSGFPDIVTDAPVARDVNGLPYIPGSSLAGLLRHSLCGKSYFDSLFGYQKNEGGQGSRLIVSDALIVGKDGRAVDGLQNVEHDEFLKKFDSLPVRQHVAIDSAGTAKKSCKFDEEVVFAGTRFCFEMEILSENGDSSEMHDIVEAMASPMFRIGGGTRNGFGSMKVVRVQYAAYDLSNREDLEAYLQKSSSLADSWKATCVDVDGGNYEGWIKYTLMLQPVDFFLFSSGFGDEDADMTSVKEQRVCWDSDVPRMSDNYFVVPGTSVKGAVAHRTAYHWNRFNRRFVDDGQAVDCSKNPAVISIFGTCEDSDEISPQIGNAIFSDVFLSNTPEKVIYHVKIDKFTGGTIDGALFQEKVAMANDQQLCEEIFVRKEALEDDTTKKAFEQALRDICNGLLPLGGGTNRGNGIFTGTMKIE